MLYKKKNDYKADSKVSNKINNKLKLLFRKKTELMNTFLFLNTAFSIIDKMFLREIANAEIKKKHYMCFFLNNICIALAPVRCENWFLPSNYVPIEKTGGELLRKIMDF